VGSSFKIDNRRANAQMMNNMTDFVSIHNRVNKTGHMHVWHEAHASRGSQKIASFLSKYNKIYSNSDSDKSELIAWSDSCDGQN